MPHPAPWKEQRRPMNQPDFEHARQYAFQRLERELAPDLFYHSIRHTRDEVLPAAERLAAMEGICPEQFLLLRTAATYHDIGFIEKYTGHEAVSIRIAAEVLPRFGYSPAQIQAIADIIRATKLPQSPRNLLEQIMADADLDGLGREDFWDRNVDLRAELAVYDRPVDDVEWYKGQVQFLTAHSYFTPSAHTLRAAQKQRHLDELAIRLEQARQFSPAMPSPAGLQG